MFVCRLAFERGLEYPQITQLYLLTLNGTGEMASYYAQLVPEELRVATLLRE